MLFRALSSHLFPMSTHPKEHRIWPLIGAIYGVTSLLDSTTTYVGLRWFGGRELNPHTDTSSLGGMLYQESLTLVAICILSALAEGHLKAYASQLANELSFRAFTDTIYKTRYALSWFVLTGSLLIGSARLVVIFCNILYITIGFSPLDVTSLFISTNTGLPQHRVIALFYIAMMLVLMTPAGKFLYRYFKFGRNISKAASRFIET